MILGIGVDIIEIARLRSAGERSKDRFLQRVFTLAEQQFCAKHRDPAPHYAARFAAKEALFKALGTGWAKGVTWLDAEVLREPQKALFRSPEPIAFRPGGYRSGDSGAVASLKDIDHTLGIRFLKLMDGAEQLFEALPCRRPFRK